MLSRTAATRLLRPASARAGPLAAPACPAFVASAAVRASAVYRAALSTAPRRPQLRLQPRLPAPLRGSGRGSSGGARALSDHTRTAIDRAVGSAPVVLFMKGTPELPQCGFSRAVIQILGLQGVDPDKFAAFNVLEDTELRAGIKEYSDWPTIPQLYVDKEFVGGCDILVAMHQSGELAKLFEDKKVLIAVGDGGEGEAAAKE